MINFADSKDRDRDKWGSKTAHGIFGKPDPQPGRGDPTITGGGGYGGEVQGQVFEDETEGLFQRMQFSESGAAKLREEIQDRYPGGLPAFSVAVKQAIDSAARGNRRGLEMLEGAIGQYSEKFDTMTDWGREEGQEESAPAYR